MNNQKKQTGGPVEEMTLRDYFAAKALGGMFAADTPESIISDVQKVEFAYRIADAMLEERK